MMEKMTEEKDIYEQIDELAKAICTSLMGGECYWRLIQLDKKSRYWAAAQSSITTVIKKEFVPITFIEYLIYKGIRHDADGVRFVMSEWGDDDRIRVMEKIQGKSMP